MIGSQQSSVPKGLPMLPGNGFKDPTITDFKKSHIFDVHQGIPVSHDPSLVAPAASFSGKVAPPRMAPMPTAEIQPVQVTQQQQHAQPRVAAPNLAAQLASGGRWLGAASAS